MEVVEEEKKNEDKKVSGARELLKTYFAIALSTFISFVLLTLVVIALFFVMTKMPIAYGNDKFFFLQIGFLFLPFILVPLIVFWIGRLRAKEYRAYAVRVFAWTQVISSGLNILLVTLLFAYDKLVPESIMTVAVHGGALIMSIIILLLPQFQSGKGVGVMIAALGYFFVQIFLGIVFEMFVLLARVLAFMF